jgi:hypothetical protein
MATDEKIVSGDAASIGEVEGGKVEGITINASGHIQELDRNFVNFTRPIIKRYTNTP